MTDFTHLKAKGRKTPKEANDSPPLASHCLYSPRTLQAAMGIGRLIYEGLLAEGLPRSYIKGRYFFSGRLVLEWIESRTDTP